MKKRFVIVEKSDPMHYKDRLYWRDEITGFIQGINGACLFHLFSDAEKVVLDLKMQNCIIQIEEVYVNE